MKIHALKVNQLINPLGYDFSHLSFSYQVTGTEAHTQQQASLQIALDPDFQKLVWDSGCRPDLNPVSITVDPKQISLHPRTRYWWRVQVWTDLSETAISDRAWFETAKMDEPWQADWITPSNLAPEGSPLLFTGIKPASDKKLSKARLYVCGLGLYEAYMDGHKIGDEFLAPGCHVYSDQLFYQTYDLTEKMQRSHEHTLSLLLGDGWYKGHFGFKSQNSKAFYGDKYQAICELWVSYTDGSEQVFTSNNDWFWQLSSIQSNSFYDGECCDLRIESPVEHCQILTGKTNLLRPRVNQPVKIQQRIQPTTIQKTKDGSFILDFGANRAGWVESNLELNDGETITFSFAEHIHQGELYRDNLRHAKAQWTLTGNGQKKTYRPHFTYFGFRYVQISGYHGTISSKDISACILSSDLEQTAALTTSHPLVNQFITNVFHSQQSNFIDVPTDCPQRDERMGWTGDIQVFTPSACFNSNAYAFLSKYVQDIACEQKKLNGGVPHVVPMFDIIEGGSSGWGDAATILPWTLWTYYGDLNILRQQYASMKQWVDYIIEQVGNQHGDTALWNSGFHFGDWLALDKEPDNPSFKGKTEDQFIASIYFGYSCLLVSKSARLIGKPEDSTKYQDWYQRIWQDLREEYVSPRGRLVLDTQTAYVLATVFDVVPPEHQSKMAIDFLKRFKTDHCHVTTGFLGSPLICQAMTKLGLNNEAYDLFLNQDCPSWLYPVTMGATSVWERWDSILPDGQPNPHSDMNSLNHYAFGSVIHWLYTDVCGLKPMEDHPGFAKVSIKPVPNDRIRNIHLNYQSVAGPYDIKWQLSDEGKLQFQFSIPFNCNAEVTLPNCMQDELQIVKKQPANMQQHNQHLQLNLHSGNYEFIYQPTTEYIRRYHCGYSLQALMDNPSTRAELEKLIPDLVHSPFIGVMFKETLNELAQKPFFGYPATHLNLLNKALHQHRVIFTEDSSND